ncbi:hypothetical protein D3C85_1017390 [compost metagenome]
MAKTCKGGHRFPKGGRASVYHRRKTATDLRKCFLNLAMARQCFTDEMAIEGISHYDSFFFV